MLHQNISDLQAALYNARPTQISAVLRRNAKWLQPLLKDMGEAELLNILMQGTKNDPKHEYYYELFSEFENEINRILQYLV